MISGIIQQPTSLLLTTASVTDVLTVASGTVDVVTVNRLKIVNQDTSDRKVTVWWHDGTTAYAIFEGTVGANSTITDDEVDVKLFAKTAAKKIQAQAAAGNVVTVTLITSRSPQARDANLTRSGN